MSKGYHNYAVLSRRKFRVYDNCNFKAVVSDHV